ncbi:DUF2118 domain-containing protein [Romboutsia sp. 1001713B170131_170501_G6]|uniref:DUF2118 domain-containing protein n=1 Tax=Romboutsia sp. 1001713B170131_170501_G6 TaxID=2787108 RepID=UPI0018A99B72|nr:DUF2118 domain-containing protein [Romboutsia sp. 1001713B170131_170501_G6]
MSCKKYNITVNGKVYEVEIEEVLPNTEKEFKVNKNIEIKKDRNQEKIRESNNNTRDDKVIKAPMPGTIVNVLVKQGDNVKKGQVIAILEAMKMENEIVSPTDGSVEIISVDKGQNVSLGDSLLKIV